MIKNESQFYFKSNLKKNNSMILKCRTSKSNNLSSRNPVFEIKNKVSSKFKLFKNLTIYKNHSKKFRIKKTNFLKMILILIMKDKTYYQIQLILIQTLSEDYHLKIIEVKLLSLKLYILIIILIS